MRATKLNITSIELKKSVLFLLSIFIISLGISIAVGINIYNNQKNSLKEKTLLELDLVNTYKGREISKWLKHTIEDQYYIFNTPHNVEIVHDLLINGTKSKYYSEVSYLIDKIQVIDSFKSVALVDKRGKVFYSAPGNSIAMDEHKIEFTNKVVKTKKQLFTDLYLCPNDNEVYLTSYYPLIKINERDTLVIAVAIIDLDPYKTIYPLVEAMPFQSQSAESYLVSPNPTYVKYISSLRFVDNKKIQYKKPIDNWSMLSIKAISGVVGASEGIDYRGKEVLGAVSGITNTNWYLIVKMDKDEVYSKLNSRALIISLVAIALFLLLSIGIYAYTRRTKILYYKDLYQREVERKALQIHYEKFLNNANDIIFLIDDKGIIVDANYKAVEKYGYAHSELIGMYANNIRVSSSKKEFEKTLSEVKTFGGKVYTLNHKKKNGEILPVEVSTNLISIDDKNYFQAIIRDITERVEAEKKLLESEKRFRSIFENTITGIYRTTPDGNILLANPALLKLLGFSSIEELQKRNFEEIGIDINYPRQKFKDLMERDGKVIGFESAWHKSDGTIAYIQESAVAQRDEDGIIIHYDGIVEDITEKKIAEDKLRKSEERYKRFFDEDLTGDFVSTLDGKIIMCNNALVEILKYKDKEEILNKSASDLYWDPNNRINLIEKLKKDKKVVNLELELKACDGSKVNVVENVLGIFDDNGELVQLSGYMFDITARKKAEEEFRASEKRFRETLETIQLISVQLDITGKVIYCNPYLLDLTGYTYDEVIGEDWFKMFIPKNHTEVIELFEKAVRESKIETYFENPILTKAGEERIIQWNNTLLRDSSGSMIGTTSIGEDVTDRKKAENALLGSEKRYRDLFNYNPLPMWAYDLETLEFIEVNDAAIEHYGYSREEFLNMTIKDIRPEEDIEKLLLNINNSKAREIQGIDHAGVWRHILKNGDLRNVEITSHPITFNNRKAELVLVNDITDRLKAEKLLIENEKRFREVIENAVENIFTTDNKGYFTYANPAALKLSGYSLEELVDLKFSDLVTPEFQRRVSLTYYRQFLERNEVTYTEYPFKTKLGDVKWFGQNARLIMENDEVKGFYIIARDITERKLAELALAESERKFKEMANLLPQIIFEMDEIGNLTYVNEISFKLFGYTKEDFSKKLNALQMIHPKERAIASENILKVMSGENPTTHEYTALRKDGTCFPIYILSTPIIRGKKVIGLRGTIMDLTARREAEDQIRLLSRAVEESPVAIMITNPEAKIQYVNPKFTELTEYTLDEILGKEPKLLKSGLTPIEAHSELWATLKKGEVWKGEFINKTKSGRIYYESAIIVPIKNGHLTHYVALKEDITERKQMLQELVEAKERAEESDKLKTEFLAQMSHEVRTPLNAMLSFSSLVQEELDEKELADDLTKESFNGIQISGKRIIRTIDLILNSSELQTGVYKPSYKELKLYQDVIHNIKAEFKLLAEEKGLEFHLESLINDDSVYVDEYSVKQIFINLIDNAIKYTQTGFIKLKIFRNQLPNVIVTVEDTGIGISQEYMPKLFELFTQEEQGYTRSYDGNGLGMFLVKKYCDLNKIEIEVVSEKGRGTLIKLIFPVAEIIPHNP
jgi:PAS domain S-box-containing protein